ncbi:MAG: hypothetical protein CSA34_05465 [Desulfobulbus propionicus]|nr:MAG: hypothetical protein CSA34_05465 [Desulfobulbus propionicus]
MPVPSGLRKKIFRCTCGLATTYTLNHRKENREVTSGKALVILSGGQEYPVYLTDLSVRGVGFTMAPQYCRFLSSGGEVNLKYRSASGGLALRKLRVVTITGNRIGGQFTDGFILT